MARAYRRHWRELQSEINIVPLLDILLVLLLIFIATTPIIIQNVKVDLADSANSTSVSHVNNLPVILEVSGIDQYSMVIDRRRITLLKSAQIEAEVKSHLSSNPKTVFLIGGAKNIPYNEIIKALNILNKAGVSSVGLITQSI